MTEIYVCQAGSCRRRGSEAVLLEIEELANAVVDHHDGEHCSVEGSGCLGLCNRAPAAMVVTKQRTRSSVFIGTTKQAEKETYFTQIDSLAKSENVVWKATGKKPPTDNPELQQRLSGVRAIRMREHSASVHRWNGALQASNQIIAPSKGKSSSSRREHLAVHQELLTKAGFPGGVIVIPKQPPLMPETIDKYSQWSLERLTIVSKHSAIFHFQSTDRKRGTPNPRGGGRPPPQPKTWHTTLLAAVGRNVEGPLPWIERDYTPISSAKEWDQGKCDILIKIYNDGAATSWLRRLVGSMAEYQQEEFQEGGSNTTTDEPPLNNTPLRFWLSQPVQTLSVPALVTGTSFNPASVLLLLAGTGVVLLPQVLHHRDPYGKIGISTKRSQQLHVPVDLILSCRIDDVLMLPDIVTYSREGSAMMAGPSAVAVTKGLRSSTLLLTDKNNNNSNNNTAAAGAPVNNNDKGKCTAPFPGFVDNPTALDELRALPNARVLNDIRLNIELVIEAVGRMSMPCRVVVSGPSGFNGAARSLLLDAGVDVEAITILEA
jgi:Thioredoxin-like [2Fe-2S] ferredoxin/Oxidoreductase FAD-binding domain